MTIIALRSPSNHRLPRSRAFPPAGRVRPIPHPYPGFILTDRTSFETNPPHAGSPLTPGRQEGTWKAADGRSMAAPATVRGEPTRQRWTTGFPGRSTRQGRDPPARRPAGVVTQPMGGASMWCGHTQRWQFRSVRKRLPGFDLPPFPGAPRDGGRLDRRRPHQAGPASPEFRSRSWMSRLARRGSAAVMAGSGREVR